MRYSQIRSIDVSNGEGIGIALFTQGCHIHCKGCFNTIAWDFNSGKEWNVEVKDRFFQLINRPYIKRISILGGEPLSDENLIDLVDLLKDIRCKFPDKKIWLYSGYKFEAILHPDITDEFNLKRDKNIYLRQKIVHYCDVLVDGRYIEEEKDMTLAFRGSRNQRVINLPETFKQKKIVLYCE